MIQKLNTLFDGLHTFIILWATQGFSALGSSMTSYALVIWAYQQEGSALASSLLTVCSYAPYVLLSIFAGALSDRWNKKRTMLVCDSFAALCTLSVLVLLVTGQLKLWHLYVINALNGLGNTLQQPASDVAVSLLTPREQYQKAAGMRAFSNSLVTILSPVFATALLSAFGIYTVIAFDLLTFTAAFLSLAFFVKLPEQDLSKRNTEQASVLQTAGQGLRYLRENRGILDLILFLACINLVASVYNAALPAMLLSRDGGSQAALALVSTCTGLANVTGSVIATFLPAPKSRVRAICLSLLFSMSTENFLLALGRGTPVWCLGAILGWLFIPVMNTNMDALFRTHIPVEMQGRVYSARNTLQFFTIPVGYLLGGVLVDQVFEPFMADQDKGSIPSLLFGTGKGSGAAFLFFVIAFAGILVCLYFQRDRHIWELEAKRND